MSQQSLWLILSKVIAKAFVNHAGIKVLRKPHASGGLTFSVSFLSYRLYIDLKTDFFITIDLSPEIYAQASIHNLHYLCTQFENFLRQELKGLMKAHGDLQQKRVEAEWGFGVSELE